jgi:hypothetical protein
MIIGEDQWCLTSEEDLPVEREFHGSFVLCLDPCLTKACTSLTKRRARTPARLARVFLVNRRILQGYSST